MSKNASRNALHFDHYIRKIKDFCPEKKEKRIRRIMLMRK